MVIANDLSLDYAKQTATVSLFADQKSDITDSMVVEGIPEGFTIAFGSSCMTADGELGFMKSNGQWNWLG